MHSRCVRKRHLALVGPLAAVTADSPEVTSLKTELFEIRNQIRELVELADAEARDIRTAELYEIAAIPLSFSIAPQAHHFCKTCNMRKAGAVISSNIALLRPTPLCSCPPELKTIIYCEAYEKMGGSITRCMKRAPTAHRNNENLVCSKHRDSKDVVTNALSKVKVHSASK